VLPAGALAAAEEPKSEKKVLLPRDVEPQQLQQLVASISSMEERTGASMWVGSKAAHITGTQAAIRGAERELKEAFQNLQRKPYGCRGKGWGQGDGHCRGKGQEEGPAVAPRHVALRPPRPPAPPAENAVAQATAAVIVSALAASLGAGQQPPVLGGKGAASKQDLGGKQDFGGKKGAGKDPKGHGSSWSSASWQGAAAPRAPVLVPARTSKPGWMGQGKGVAWKGGKCDRDWTQPAPSEHLPPSHAPLRSPSSSSARQQQPHPQPQQSPPRRAWDHRNTGKGGRDAGDAPADRAPGGVPLAVGREPPLGHGATFAPRPTGPTEQPPASGIAGMTQPTQAPWPAVELRASSAAPWQGAEQGLEPPAEFGVIPPTGFPPAFPESEGELPGGLKSQLDDFSAIPALAEATADAPAQSDQIWNWDEQVHAQAPSHAQWEHQGAEQQDFWQHPPPEGTQDGLIPTQPGLAGTMHEGGLHGVQSGLVDL